MDAILAFPPLILAMGVTVGLGVGLKTAAIGTVLPSIPWYARLMRSEVIQIRTRPFIEATAALGATQKRIIARHILPHTVTTMAVQTRFFLGYDFHIGRAGLPARAQKYSTPE